MNAKFHRPIGSIRTRIRRAVTDTTAPASISVLATANGWTASPLLRYVALGCKIVHAVRTTTYPKTPPWKTSLPERSEHVAEQLAAITDVIRELVGDDLVMLILFGSYARGDWVNDRYVEGNIVYSYQSDFDLLVVTRRSRHATVDGEFRLSDAIGRRLHRLGLDRPSSTSHRRGHRASEQRPPTWQLLFHGHQEGGRVLFDNGRHTLAEACPLDPAEYQKYAREDFEHWFPSACGFVTNVRSSS